MAARTIPAVIDRHAADHGDDIFLVDPEHDRTLTFGQLKAGAEAVRTCLDRLGVARGAKVAFLLDNGYWTAQLFLGVMAAGRVIVPLNAVSGTQQLVHVLGHSDAELVFVSAAYKDRLAELRAAVGRDIRVVELDEARGPAWPVDGNGTLPAPASGPNEGDPALLLYTSGSTGLPKGAVMNQRAIVTGGENVVLGHGLGPGDRVLCVLPIYHINGAMVTVVAPLVSGGSVVMPSRFRASRFWGLVAAHGCTWSSVVPTIIKYLLDRAAGEPFDFGADPRLAAFRFGRSASAPLPAVVLRQWEDTFRVPMIETIGLTETSGTVATNPMPPRARKPGSVGFPCGNEIRVVDEAGNECAPHVPGELVVRGDNVLDCYYKNPEATEGAFFGEWFRTGDLGKKDDEGYLYITGRLKELIIRGGENIAPREIDDVLYRHEAVLEAAAVGVDDENYGQEVVACVVIRDGHRATEEELKTFCEQAVGGVKCPKVIYFMDDLPKGPSGKIQRLRLPGMIRDL